MSSITYEVPSDGGLTAPSVLELKEAIDDLTATTEVIGQTLNFYDGDEYVGESLGDIGEHGALTRSETLVLTDDILDDAYPDLTAAPDVDGTGVAHGVVAHLVERVPDRLSHQRADDSSKTVPATDATR